VDRAPAFVKAEPPAHGAFKYRGARATVRSLLTVACGARRRASGPAGRCRIAPTRSTPAAPRFAEVCTGAVEIHPFERNGIAGGARYGEELEVVPDLDASSRSAAVDCARPERRRVIGRPADRIADGLRDPSPSPSPIDPRRPASAIAEDQHCGDAAVQNPR
jgi:hypothetical protein